MINIPKGTKDVLPSESYKWQYLEALARDTARLFNAREIRTPAFEHTELFLRSIGGDTDVVSKEMYTFTDKGNRSITLKPEGTASVARSYIENSLENESLPLKMYYITPVFRYERPQAGRLREHHQFGVEAYGSPSYQMDAEIISLAYSFLTRAGIEGVSLRLNNIGCPTCRSEYNAALKAYLAAYMDSLCSTCRERFVKNPLRILDCKVEECKKIVQNSPKIIDHACTDCSLHFDGLKRALDKLNISYSVDPDIVRGLDYYTKTVFEFVSDAIGAQGTVCGGGRYDNMVSEAGGKPTPCVGFGIGLERLLIVLQSLDKKIDTPALDIFVAPQAQEHMAECVKIVAELRTKGISAETDFMSRSVKSQLKYASKIKAEHSAVIGGNEIESGTVQIKNMNSGQIQNIQINKIAEFFGR